MTTVQKLWEDFEKHVLTPQATDVQRGAIRSSFYAGAASILKAIMDMSGDEVTEEAFTQTVNGLIDEVDDFINDAVDSLNTDAVQHH